MNRIATIAITAAFASGIAWTNAGAIDGKHVNGYVVTEQWRKGSYNWTPQCCECGSSQAGDIQLVTISSGVVSKTETIYSRSQGLGQYPTFNVEATKVAFYRYSLKPQTGDDKGWNSDVEIWGSGLCPGRLGSTGSGVDGGTSYVSIMDRDGSNVRNLVALRDQPFSEAALDWPPGDWIYYLNPRTGSRDDYRLSSELRRVNVRTLADELVYDWTSNGKFFRRFELSRDGKYAGVQTYPIPGMTANPSGDLNGVIAFPPARGAWPSQICSWAGCNASLSPSGTRGANYFAGAHTSLFTDKIDYSGSNKCSGGPEFDLFYIPDQGWFHASGNVNAWLPQPFFDGSEVCQVIRFANNSDKWILQTAYHADNGNSVAANWVDKTAFMVSTNVGTYDANHRVSYGNNTGDMWVDGGAENLGKWEDTAGVWHAVPGYIPTSIAGSHERTTNYRAGVSFSVKDSRIQLSLPAGTAFLVAVFDECGAMLVRENAAGTAVLGDRALTPGVYQVVAARGKEVYRGSVTIVR
jgi:hypothetical protein